MIITFYSFKGGLGRSMTLANIAEILYKRWWHHKGLRVLVIDWDLEAPGVDKFFQPVVHDGHDLRKNPGLIDMMVAYKEWGRKPPGEIFEPPPSVSDYIQDIYPPDERGVHLKLISAGRRDGDHFEQYAQLVKSFDWKDFYDNWEGERYIEWVRNRLEELSDIILIDSRTGVTEIGNVCLYHLADLVIAFTSASRQSLEGTARVLRTFKSPRVQQLRTGRPLQAIVVPARVEDKAEIASYNIFKQEFSRLFDQYCPQNWYEETQQTLWELKIPYVPLYAFEELVAIRQAGTEQASDLLEQAFHKLLQAIDYVMPLPRPGPRSVLIVEDDERWQHLLRELLSMSEYEVHIANTAQNGIEKLQKNSYGLILLNLNLGSTSGHDYDGLGVLRWIKELGSDIPVVIVTGSPVSMGQFRRWPMVKDIIFKGTDIASAHLQKRIQDLVSQSLKSPMSDVHTD